MDILDAPYTSLALRWLLGWIFLTSAIDKLRHRSQFATVLRQLPFPPAATSSLISVVVPIAELLLAIQLLLGPYWRGAALGVALLLLIFTTIIVIGIQSHSTAACACGGLLPTQAFTTGHVAFNAFLFALALLLAAQSTSIAALPQPLSYTPLPQRHVPLDFASLLAMSASLSVLILSVAVYEVVRVARIRTLADAQIFQGRQES